MEKIVVDISKNNLLGMLSEYYSNLNGKQIKIRSKVSNEDVYGYTVTKYYFYYEEYIKIYNQDVKQTYYLSEEEIKEALKEIINREGYSISSIIFSREKRQHESYLYEWTEDELTNVEVTLVQKEKTLKLER